MSKSNYSLGFSQQFYSSIPEGYLQAEALMFDSPKLVYFNQTFAESLNASLPSEDDALAALFAGQQLPDDAKPIAQAYAGHQFGQFNPQLGDGRAMILGEISGRDGGIYELDLKGSGPTPFSRGGDGKAAMGPMLREVLVSEAMHALGIATTRSLAVVATGEKVYRSPPQPGAVLARTATSHIRIGTFQFFAARKQYKVVKQLVAFCIERHYPQLQSEENLALALLNQVVSAQAELVAQWMGLGFIHGVMNTDNMLVGGETIDYGPCAFMDTYDPNTVFSSIDQRGRYAYSNQPGVAQWNLSRFAETLLPLIDEDEDSAIELATKAVQAFNEKYITAFRSVMCAKLGLDPNADVDTVNQVIDSWSTLLHQHKVDWTLAHYYLTQAVLGDDQNFMALFSARDDVARWLKDRGEVSARSLLSLKSINPCVIPRNQWVEDALYEAGMKDNFAPFEQLLQALQRPFDWPADERYVQPAEPAFNDAFVTFCGT